ncbi:MAG: GAP1-N2 domain-containing protein [Isosphaeraceae bacterium]
MSQELHYTSVPRGLKPGSRGFATVAATAGLPDAMAERLEGLSGYQAVYPPGDPSESLNPVAFVHVRLSVGSQRQDVLSRIGPAGLDYSGRPNKYAHHIVLGPDERPAAGPAWLLSQPGLFQDSWQGEPRTIPDGPAVPRGDRPPGVAQRWQAITGDAGWAGVLAESFLADPRRPVFLVYSPGTELLPLFVEAIALLPPSRRWDVDFSTYLTNLPPGIHCAWRGVLDGSAEAKNARRLPGALFIDLVRPAGRARGGGALVHFARTGERLAEEPGRPAAAASATRLGHGSAAGAGAGSAGTNDLAATFGPPRPPTAGPGGPPRPSGDGVSDDNALPDLAAQLFQDGSWREGEVLASRRRRHPAVAPVAAVLAVLIVALSIYASPAARRWIGLDHHFLDGDRPGAARGPANGGGVGTTHTVADAKAKAGAEAKPGGPAMPLPVAGTTPLDSHSPKASPPKADSSRTPQRADVPPARSLVPVPPVVLAVATPDLSRSSLGKGSSSRGEIALPRPADDRVILRNASAFLLVEVPRTPQTWEIATRSNSVFAAAFALARLTRVDDRTWQFAWTDKAKSKSTVVAELKDAILEFHAQDGGLLHVMLRGVPPRVDRPIDVWKEQRLVEDPKGLIMRSVPWTTNPDALDRTRWKPVIRRWRAVISRPEPRDGGNGNGNGEGKGDGADGPRRVVEPDPVAVPEAAADDKENGKGKGNGKARVAPADAPPPPVPLEGALIPGEVKLRLGITPDHPGNITVRIEYDPARVHDGREARATRLDKLCQNTPRDRSGELRDPLAYRNERLRGLRDNGEGTQRERQRLEQEIAELKSLNQLRETEDLLDQPARVTLSLVVSLDVEGVGLIDISRIGDPDGDGL